MSSTQKLDGRVDAGVYGLLPDKLESLKGHRPLTRETAPAASEGPILVFIHGTFVETTSTFGKLWEKYPERVRQLFDYYGGRVYALDHATLSASPIQNALTLAEAMPKGAKLHLVTHSRGGIVGEVLARVCGGQGLQPEELALFGKPEYQQHLEDIRRLEAIAKGHIEVQRMVRVACPARGTLLASKRLDAYLSVLKWGLELAGVPVVPEFLDFLHAARPLPRAPPGSRMEGIGGKGSAVRTRAKPLACG